MVISRTFKPSVYNYITEDADQNTILYNSLSKKICRIDKSQKSEVLDLLKKDTISDDRCDLEILNSLIKNGYLVKEGTDEHCLSNLQYLEEIMNNELELTLMPTEQCNFRCTYCYEDFINGDMSNAVQEGLIKYVIKNIHKHKSMTVSWFGGEPLEAFHIIDHLSKEFISICQKRYKPYFSGITTNGYNLNIDMFQKLLSKKVLGYHVTIDGLKETHDKQRVTTSGDGTFDRIISNLRDIKKNIKKKRFTITIRTNVTRDIYDCFEEYLHFLQDEFGNDERFTFYFRPVGDWGGNVVQEMSESLLSVKEYEKVYSVLKNTDVLLNYKLYSEDLSHRFICYASKRNSYIIGSNGTVYKCSSNLDNPANIIGHIYKDGRMELDLDKMAKWIARFDKKPSKCGVCFFEAVCHSSGCVAPAVLKKKEIKCPFGKVYIESTLRLLGRDDRYVKKIP